MKTVVLQSNYIPWRGYFDLIHKADLFIFYDEVKYTKNDWRNRNKLANYNNDFWLTIPIQKDAVKQKISEVRLPQNDWTNEHWASIWNCYKKAHFSKDLDAIKFLWLENKFTSLSEFNQHVTKTICKNLGIATEFKNSSQFDLEGDKILRLLNVLLQAGTTEYISGPSAKNYLTEYENLFLEKGIKIIYADYTHYQRYNQFNNQFFPFVSIIDTIAHLGFNGTLEYLIYNK